MPLDRQAIEKKDFPISRRGYDVDAVDTHLRLLAEEVDELKRSGQRRTESLASTAAAEVQAIVSAAETAAAKIQGDAERDADEIRRLARNDAKNTRDEADRDARSTRETATTQASEYVSGVSESTTSLLQRVETVDQELNGVIDAVRTAATRLQGELRDLEGTLGEVKDAVSPRAGGGGGYQPATAVSHEPEAAEDEAEEFESFDEAHEAPGEVESGLEEPPYEAPPAEEEEPASTTVAPPPPPSVQAFDEPTHAPQGESPDEGARLIALNMALNGAPREEVDRYLAENFDLENRNSLIDEVYAAIDS